MALPMAAGTYGIDAMHSQLGFTVTHLGISLVSGTFDGYTGALTVGEELGDTSVSIEATMTSVNSGNPMRDEHIHGADFFDVASFPTMSFASTSIADSASGSGYTLSGDLTIKGVSQPVSFEVAYNGSSVFPMDQSTHHGFRGVGIISRTAFDMGYGVPMVSDDVDLSLDLQFIAPAA